MCEMIWQEWVNAAELMNAGAGAEVNVHKNVIA